MHACMRVHLHVCTSVFLKSSNVMYIGPHGLGETMADPNTGVEITPPFPLGLQGSLVLNFCGVDIRK